MRLTYLGTAASEGLPALFCQCPVCEHARKVLGREFRSRSSALINDNLLIDICPDIYHASLRAGISLPDVRDLVITHSHEDHYDVYELSVRATDVTCKRREGENYDMQVYGNRKVESMLPFSGKADGFKFNCIEPFKPFQAGGVTVTALTADHDPREVCFIYLFEQDGKRILYGNDTGLFPSETMEYLKGIRCDLISLDCTFVMMKQECGHMGIEADIKLKNLLIEQGTADSNTLFILNHFSHNGFIPDGKYYTLNEFEKIASENGFTVSYDTMSVTV